MPGQKIINMKIRNSFLLILFVLCVAELRAQTFYTEIGKAVFHSEVPLHTFTGESQHLIGRIDLEEKVVDFYLDLETLETGIGKRDQDMKQTLNVKEHPFAEFYGELVSDFDTTSSEVQKAVTEGTFKIHGVEREIRVEGTLQKTGNGLLLKAGWTLLLKDYDIEPPSLLFVRVDQEQDIEIEALLEPSNE